MKRILFFIFFLLFNNSLFAQTVDNVTLVTTGSAATEEEAVLVALRGAIEQTFGTFVSANTTLLNDDLIKDEIVSVSRGNVKQYEKIATTILSNGQIMVTVKSEISVSNLISYAHNKGSKAEFAGATFGQNIKLMRLKSKNTRTVYENLCTQVIALLDNAFDYEIKLQEPVAVKLYNVTSEQGERNYYRDGYKIDAIVTVRSNEVNNAIYRLVNGTLKAISLSRTEYLEYNKLGMDCCVLAGHNSSGTRGLSTKEYLQLDNERFSVYLPISNQDIIELDQPVIEKMNKGFFNYVIKDPGHDMDYTWRLLRSTDIVLGYRRGDNYRDNYDIINNGRGLFNSKNMAYNGYCLKNRLFNLSSRDNSLFFNNSPTNSCYSSTDWSYTIVGFGCEENGRSYRWENWESSYFSFINLNNLNLGDYGRIIWDKIEARRKMTGSAYRGMKKVLPEEITYALDKQCSENDRMEIAKRIISKKELKESLKKKQVIDGQLIVSYFPVEKISNNFLLNYQLSFFFTEDEILKFTGLEIVPHKY